MILVFGAVNVDFFYQLSAFPRPDETLLGEDAQVWPGGKGANQAVAAALDGARVCLAGAVGRDALAALALAGPKAARIDLSRVRAVEHGTGTSVVLRDAKGQTQIVMAAGANLFARAAQVEDAVLGSGTVLLLQMGVDRAELATLIRRARAGGARIVLNFSPVGMIDTDALRLVDVLLVDEEDAGWLAEHLGAGVGAGSLQAALGVAVVRTMGVIGVEFADADGHTRKLAPHAVDEVDRTAAQDCFAGVLAAALDRGTSLPDAVGRANVAAGLSCSRLGLQVSFPSRADIDDAIEGGLRRDLAALRRGAS